MLTDAVQKHLAATRTPTSVVLDDKYFCEPVLISSGVLAAGTTGAAFADIDLRYELINSVPRWRERLNGWRRWRATWHVKLLVSPSPYVSGVLRWWHEPPLTAGFTLPTPIVRTLRWEVFSQAPGVDLDVGEINSVCIEVPHISPVPWMETQSGFDNGSVRGNYIVPLALGTGSGVLPSYQAWVWLSDVEVDGRKPLDTEMSDIVPTMAYGTKKGGEAAKEDKPVSTFLMSAARLSTFMGKRIPFITAYTTPVSWAARTAAKVASAFGFSKPDRNTSIVTVYNNRQGYGLNATGLQVSTNVGLLHDAAVNPGFTNVTTVDEMSKDYVTGIKFPLTISSFTAEQAAGAYLLKGVITPWGQFHSGTLRVLKHIKRALLDAGGVGRPFWPGPAFLFNSFFSLWRGDMVITIKFAKTRFHAGRVEFLYYYDPIDAAATALPVPTTFETAHSVYRQEFDLAAGSEYEIRIPYAYNAAYCGFNNAIGIYAMRVISPLVSPDTVSPTVPFTVMTHWENMEFASPINRLMSPVASAEEAPLYPAMNPVCEMTVGECVDSVKQLLMKETMLRTIDTAQFNAVQPLVPGANMDTSNPLNVWRWCYSYEKGGFVYRFSDTKAAKAVRSMVNHGLNTVTAGPLAPIMFGNTVEGGRPREQDVAIRVQRYSPLITWPVAASEQVALNNGFGFQNPTLQSYIYNADGTSVTLEAGFTSNIYQSVADDYRLVHWYSTIPIQFTAPILG